MWSAKNAVGFQAINGGKIDVLGLRQLMALRGWEAFFVCCEHRSKRPEQVGAFAGTTINAFSHSLVRRFFIVLLLYFIILEPGEIVPFKLLVAI